MISLSLYLPIFRAPCLHLCLLLDIQSMLNFTLNQVTAFLLSALFPSLRSFRHLNRFAFDMLLSPTPLPAHIHTHMTPPPLPNLDFPPPPSFCSSFYFSSPSYILRSLAVISSTQSALFLLLLLSFLCLLFSFPLSHFVLPSLSSFSRLLVFAPSLSLSLLKMSFSSWSSLTRNHCVSLGVGGDGFRGWRGEGQE